MIDSHCHLEQKDYDKDLDKVIENCKKELKAVITSCAHPRDFNKTIEIAEKYKGFVFATVGMHPEYIKEFTEDQIDEFIERIKQNKDKFVGIGEIGLDYFWVKEDDQRERQRELFIKMIKLAKEINLPIIVHCREAYEDALEILEQEKPEKVLLHMWGKNILMDRVNKLGYYISMNSIVMRSKGHRKIIKSLPDDKLLLETDSPWLGLKKTEDGFMLDNKIRNTPLTIKLVAQKIAELRKVPFEQLWVKCRDNAIRFYNLDI